MCLFVLMQNIHCVSEFCLASDSRCFIAAKNKEMASLTPVVAVAHFADMKISRDVNLPPQRWYSAGMTTQLHNRIRLSVCSLKHCCNKQRERSRTAGEQRDGEQLNLQFETRKERESKLQLHTTLHQTQQLFLMSKKTNKCNTINNTLTFIRGCFQTTHFVHTVRHYYILCIR